MCYLTRPTSTGLLYVQWLSGKRSYGSVYQLHLRFFGRSLSLSTMLHVYTCICMDSKFDAWHCLLLIDDSVPGDKIGAEAEVVDSERIHSGILI